MANTHTLIAASCCSAPQRTYPNLFDAHPPFQIDGNFGGTAGITEMLLQSWGGSILLLPALPGAWPTGSARGLRVRNAAGIDMAWRDGRLQHAILHSDREGTTSRPSRRGPWTSTRHQRKSPHRLELRNDRLVRA